MPESSQAATINSKYILAAGFGSILGLLVMLLLIWYSNVSTTQREIDAIVNVHNEKSALIADMRDITRTRAMSLYRLRLLVDPVEIEQEQLNFNLMEGNLLVARLRFTELPLSQAEQNTWNSIKNLLDIDRHSQQKTLELVLHSKMAEVDLNLLDYVIPTQKNLVKQFSNLLNIQRVVIRNAAGVVRKAHDKTLSITVILGATATIIGVLIAILTIRRTSHAEVALLRASSSAQEANRLKSEFIANMSHELRTPLNAILGYGEVLIEDSKIDGNDVYIKDLEKITTSGNELLALINSMLDLSKIDAGKLTLHPQEISILALVNETASSIKTLAEKNNNLLKINCEPNIGIMYADELRVRQSLYNLLNNACKFSKNGVITLDTNTNIEKNGTQNILIKVSDTGIGIDREQLKKLFQPFAQLDSSISRKYGGTGLGLILTKRYCELMGGDLIAKSQKGVGSTFTIKLPRGSAD